MNQSKALVMLVVGQTPPPFGGQAILIESILKGKYERLTLRHLRMSYSSGMAEVGRVNAGKVWHLIDLIWKTFLLRLEIGSAVLYYPPSGPDLVPMLRDITYLLCTRWMFSGLVLHFHASGVSELVQRLNWPLRVLALLAYRGADCALSQSKYNPDDGLALQAKKVIILPCGIPDEAIRFSKRDPGSDNRHRLLFVGVLCEAKGVLVLLDAVRLVIERGFEVELALIGEIASETMRQELNRRLDAPPLRGRVRLTGELRGDDKWTEYRRADVFCFPSFFPAESFGLVAIEAMQFGLPVVAARWRGLQSVVEDGSTGFLVPPGDADALAERIAHLLTNPALSAVMGARGRERYLREFTVEHYYRQLEESIVGVFLPP